MNYIYKAKIWKKILKISKEFKLNSNDFKSLRFSILPLVLSQILQRLYFVIDNHFIAKLGAQALLINNIQFSFLYIGQYIGAATATSCLIFWNRAEYKDKQAGIFYLHILLSFIASFFCVIISFTFYHKILSHFSVQFEYIKLAEIYFKYGLINIILQSLFISLLGIMVAIGNERLTFLISGTMLFASISVKYIVVNLFFNGIISPYSIQTPMLLIVFSNLLLLFIPIIVMIMVFNKQDRNYKNLLNIKEIARVWGHELSSGFLTSVDPLIYAFQLGLIITTSSLLVTYQLLMQLTAIFCIVLLATMQVSIRDASAFFHAKTNNVIPNWLRTLILFGVVPTVFLLIFFLIFIQPLFKVVYGYEIPRDQFSYVILVTFGSLISQIGNALTVPIRAKKNNHIITLVYFISDYFIMLLGTQILIYFKIATPINAGIIRLIFSIVYTMLFGFFAYKSIIVRKIGGIQWEK